MKFKLRIASALLLVMGTAPAWALQLGQIQVKSALNQPLVAAIPLHPKNLTELDGLTVALASADDFARAGLQLTSTDRTLRFHVTTDNNGQKLILVTSSQSVTDPYLDFLVQVNTRHGKQLREFVVLLNPVISTPAPAVQAAPVARAPTATPAPPQSAELPASSRFPQPAEQAQTQPEPKSQPQPKPQAQPQPKPPAAPKPQVAPSRPSPPAAQAGDQIPVHRGDTLYGIASEASQGSSAAINQMMLALKSANPKAFFKDNINNLKAGAILRIPTRDEIDKISMAKVNAEVHRQYEAWRAAKPHPATVVEGTAAQAAAKTAPQPGPAAPASDHLTLVPPTGEASGAGNRPGVAGGTGSETVTGLQRQLQNDHGTLTSLKQSNADLGSRVHSLQNIADKSDKLLSLTDTTIAELQHKLAAVQSGGPATAASIAVTQLAIAKVAGPASSAPTSAQPSSKPGTAKRHPSAAPWFERPLIWIVAGLIVLALILFGLLRRRRRNEALSGGNGLLSGPGDVLLPAGAPGYVTSLQAQSIEDPGNLDAHLALCRLYYAAGQVEQFVAAAEAMQVHVHDPDNMEWHEVAVMGEELAPENPLFALPGESQSREVDEDPSGLAALRQPEDEEARLTSLLPIPDAEISDTDIVADSEPGRPMSDVPLAQVQPAPEAQPESAYAGDAEPVLSDDPVDTKLDLARAYMDMGDPVGAQGMLEEVLEEGSQIQKDEAKRLLAETSS